MKQEPVAWMFKLCFHPTKMDVCLEKPSEELYPNPIPLYTAPKELSDKEIHDIADKFIERFEYEPWTVDEIGFARAILKEASKK